MYTVLFRSEGPMQSWGTDRSLSTKPTSSGPTKSGWFGLLLSMGGKDWSDDAALAELRRCRFGTRTDQPGALVHDYRIAKDVPLAEPSKREWRWKPSEPANVYYISGADFVVGLETDSKELSDRLYSIAMSPYRVPYLGKKSCLPGIPITQPGPPVQATLFDALLSVPWLAMPKDYMVAKKDGVKVTLSVDDSLALRRTMDLCGKQYRRIVLMDDPISFRNDRRSHGARVVLVTEELLPKEVVMLRPWIRKEETADFADDSEPDFASGPEGLDSGTDRKAHHKGKGEKDETSALPDDSEPDFSPGPEGLGQPVRAS